MGDGTNMEKKGVCNRDVNNSVQVQINVKVVDIVTKKMPSYKDAVNVDSTKEVCPPYSAFISNHVGLLLVKATKLGRGRLLGVRAYKMRNEGFVNGDKIPREDGKMSLIPKILSISPSINMVK